MRCNGHLVEWNDARGFGFIQPDAGGERLFVHISAWQPRPSPEQRPQVGRALTYTVGVEQGKRRALAVRQAQAVPTAARTGRPSQSAAATACGKSRTPRNMTQAGGAYTALWVFALLWALVAWGWGVPLWVAASYAGLSLWCFATYWHDKRKAQRGGWRTPESTLHVLALSGGWPGALLAQQWLRHKSSKPSFRAVFWCTVALNMLAFVWLMSPTGRAWLPQI